MVIKYGGELPKLLMQSTHWRGPQAELALSDERKFKVSLRSGGLMIGIESSSTMREGEDLTCCLSEGFHVRELGVVCN
jgi:hypothetical protein